MPTAGSAASSTPLPASIWWMQWRPAVPSREFGHRLTIGGHRYIDGGVYSLCNADLAKGFDKVFVLAPMVDPELDDQLDGLSATSRAQVEAAHQASLAAFGVDPLDPSVRALAARAGYTQRHRAVASTAAFWNADRSTRR